MFKSGYVRENLINMRSYDDLKREWYLDIGYKICLNWLLLSVMPILGNPVVDWGCEKVAEWRAREQKIQKKMEAKLQKPEF